MNMPKTTPYPPCTTLQASLTWARRDSFMATSDAGCQESYRMLRRVTITETCRRAADEHA